MVVAAAWVDADSTTSHREKMVQISKVCCSVLLCVVVFSILLCCSGGGGVGRCMIIAHLEKIMQIQMQTLLPHSVRKLYKFPKVLCGVVLCVAVCCCVL